MTLSDRIQIRIRKLHDEIVDMLLTKYVLPNPLRVNDKFDYVLKIYKIITNKAKRIKELEALLRKLK